MASKKEELEKQIKAQEALKATFVKKGNKKFADKVDGRIKAAKEKLKELNAEAKKLEEKVKKEKKKPIAGTMTKDECNKLLEKMRGKYLTSTATEKKNIKSGRAEKDGTLKPSASLENEAETIENKSDAGLKITKKEQKAIAFNIESIVKNCVEMIQYKKDADQLIKDLIKKLGEIRADIASGRLKPGAQN